MIIDDHYDYDIKLNVFSGGLIDVCANVSNILTYSWAFWFYI